MYIKKSFEIKKDKEKIKQLILDNHVIWVSDESSKINNDRAVGKSTLIREIANDLLLKNIESCIYIPRHQYNFLSKSYPEINYVYDIKTIQGTDWFILLDEPFITENDLLQLNSKLGYGGFLNESIMEESK